MPDSPCLGPSRLFYIQHSSKPYSPAAYNFDVVLVIAYHMLRTVSSPALFDAQYPISQ